VRNRLAAVVAGSGALYWPGVQARESAAGAEAGASGPQPPLTVAAAVDRRGLMGGEAMEIEKRITNHDVSQRKLRVAATHSMRRIGPPQSGQGARGYGALAVGSSSVVAAAPSSGSLLLCRSIKSRTRARLEPRSPLARKP
jgi:hypothetical protein